MIGNSIIGNDGKVLGQYSKLSKSAYQPSEEVKKIFAKVQQDYQVAYSLQHRPFPEFDDRSLLERSRLDQETFGSYVGLEYLPVHKRWRWRGRKNTARNKLIGILAHMLAGMLYPFVYAKNEQNEEDKMAARVMRILVEDHLRKANYEMKFLFMVLSALVNPATLVEVEYLTVIQRIKERSKTGEIKITEVVDEVLSGLNLHVLPIDELLLGDFYTNDIQRQPYVMRVRRISYEMARKIHSGKYFDSNGKDLFDYVQAGTTKLILSGNDGQTLYDVEWTEADSNHVQELTVFYKDDDIELTWVGGVLIGNEKDVYNTNPFKHRRFTLFGEEWKSIPIYPFAKSYFEPIDPTGRFAYGKSGAFKLYWDALSDDKMHQIAHDGTYLDVIKPLFLSGVGKTDSVVIAPGVAVGMPQNAQVTPYQLGPNLIAALNMMNVQKEDMSESTQDKIMQGSVEPGVTAYATAKAEQNARTFLGVFGMLTADLIKQVGELTTDCVIQYATVGELDALVPEALRMNYQIFLTKGKDKGKDITNRIIFTDEFMGREMSEEEKHEREWDLYEEAGGDENSDQRIYKVNPYQFARHTYTMYVDVDRIVRKSMALERQEKVLAFNMLTDPRVAPFTDPQSVANEFVIEEFGGDDPDRLKAKGNPNEMLNSIMGMGGAPPGAVEPPVTQPAIQ